MLFADAIRAGRKRMDPLAPLTSAWRVFSYVERGFYTDQVKRMRAHFPADQLLFLRSNDLLQSHRETLQRISDFLGVCAFPSLEAKREHQRAAIAYPSELTLDDRKLLGDLFHDDLREFTELTGLDLDD